MPTSRPAPPNTADRKYFRCTSNHNVNTWLGDDPTKRYLIRTLRGAGNQPGIALTERRMYVKVRSPEAVAHAPRLLENYRSPFSGLRVRTIR